LTIALTIPVVPGPNSSLDPLATKLSRRGALVNAVQRAAVLFIEFSENFKSILDSMFRSNFMPLMA
jgi:hypothetical protein